MTGQEVQRKLNSIKEDCENEWFSTPRSDYDYSFEEMWDSYCDMNIEFFTEFEDINVLDNISPLDFLEWVNS